MIFKTGNGIIAPSDQKTSFATLSPYQPMNTKLVFQTGNGIIKTGYGIISPTSRPLRKNFFYKVFLIFIKEYKEMDLSQQEMEFFSPTSGSLIKKQLLEDVSHFFQGVKMDFQNRK